jgi:hypothetical protein
MVVGYGLAVAPKRCDLVGRRSRDDLPLDLVGRKKSMRDHMQKEAATHLVLIKKALEVN